MTFVTQQNQNNGKDAAVEDQKDQEHLPLVKKEKTETSSPMSQQALYDSVEALLRLDSKTYVETLMTDADRVLEKMIIPMSLPWTHLILNETRPVPRDIDELPAILSEGKRSEGTMYEKINKTHQISADHRFRLICSRQPDPGVVQIKRFRQPSSVFLDDIDERRTCPKQESTPKSAKELKVAMFEEAISSKRRKLDITSKPVQVKHISFRLGSTSSRAQIIQTDSTSANAPMLLQATFPDDLQKGQRVPFDQGQVIARQLGSYDVRFGLPKPSSQSSRVRSGRTRLVWSSKHIGGTRPVHHSILTGMPMDTNDHKRPLSTTVSIKLGGRVVRCNNPRSNRSATKQYEYTEQEIENAFSAAFDEDDEVDSCGNSSALKYLEGRTDEVPTVPTPQCSLDPITVTRNRQNSSLEEPPMRMSYTMTSIGDEKSSIYISPPELFSLPTEDGVVRTVCIKPGSLYSETKGPNGLSTKTPRIEASTFLSEMAARALSCAVCWGSNEQKEDIVRCSSCDFRAHASCHPGNKRQKFKADRTWKCNSCKNYYSTNKKDTKKNDDTMDSEMSDSPSAETKQCQLCNVEGGAISKFSTGWTHDVCHTWCPSGSQGQCDLCSETGKLVVRCAARGCSVKFHPMCAVVASRAAQHRQSTERFSSQCEQGDGEKDIKDEDSFLCTQYTLSTSSVTVKNEKGKDNTTHLVRLAFCGIHNSNRLPEFYGLNPGGMHYENAFSVPILPP